MRRSGVAEIELIEAADLEILHVGSQLEDLRGSLSLVEEVRLDGSDWLWESVEAVLSPIESLCRLMLDVRSVSWSIRDSWGVEVAEEVNFLERFFATNRSSMTDLCGTHPSLVFSFYQLIRGGCRERGSGLFSGVVPWMG